MEKQILLRDVPDDDVNKVVADFESEAMIVTKERQPDGKWTIRASYIRPDYEH